MNTSLGAIRISITKEVGLALTQAKKLYPTLSDPEIFKLGLSKIVREADEVRGIRNAAAHSVGEDYLRDASEDIYTVDMEEAPSS